MKKRWWIVSIVIIIILAIIGYFYLFSAEECNSEACFNLALEKCSKTVWINDVPESVWQYTVKGKLENKCIVNVKLIQIKKGTVDIKVLEGLDMDCSMILGDVSSPESDLSICSGKLKEGMQDIIIKKMHSYILSNVGKIGEELSKVV